MKGRKWNSEGITTITAIIIVVLVVGGSMLFFNEYERSTLKQSATTSTTDIVVGGYKYNFSVPTKITGFESGYVRNSGVNLWGDKVSYVSFLDGNLYKVGGYNITSGSHYTVWSIPQAHGVIADTDVGEYAQVWSARLLGGTYHAMAYIWSNGTLWTSQNTTFLYTSVVTTGKYVVFATPYRDVFGYYHIWKFNILTWEESEVKNISAPNNFLFELAEGGAENEVVYGTYGGGYYSLNVETGNQNVVISPINYPQQIDIWDDVVVLADQSTNKVKAINAGSGKTTTIDNTSGGNSPMYTPVGVYADTFVTYNIYDMAGNVYMRFYDLATDARFEIAQVTGVSPEVSTVSSDISTQYVVYYSGTMPFADMYWYSYSRLPTKANATSNATHNATTAAAPTTLESAQNFLTNNWIYIAVIIGIVAVVGYVAYRRYRSEPKYREEGAKTKVNWGLLVSIGIIVAVAIVLFMV